MATKCRRTKMSRYKIKLVQAYTVLALLVLIGGVIGFVIAKLTTGTETVTLTETVEVPSYEEGVLPEVEEVIYFDVPLSQSLQRYIYEICTDENVPVTLVFAMIEHESNFNPEVISGTNDYGLIQINAVNHGWLEDEYRCADMLNPYQNVFCGVKIIGGYLEKYEGDFTKALMAYNMGDYGAQKAWDSGVKSTNYSESIVALMQEYEEVLRNATQQ